MPKTDRQFIAVAFKEGGRRYTFHNDGPPVSVGDKVNVKSFTGGTVTLAVLEIVDTPPRFETKPIIGKHEPPPSDDALIEA